MAAPARPDLAHRLAQVPGIASLRARLGDRDDVWLVGGAVRDLLLGISPGDLDLVVDGDLAPVIARLGVPDRLHDRFGAATLRLDGVAFDLVRARRERYRHPGALPDVEPAALAEDLTRRDFSVNALAVRLSDARLQAVAGGLEDLEAGRLRVLRDTSFLDDPTRLLRLTRYAARLGFGVEPHTAALAGGAVAGGALGTVSGQRIATELALLAAEADPVAGLEQLRRFGIDAAIAPGFGLHADGDAARLHRALDLLPGDGDRISLVLAAAVAGLEPARRDSLLDALGLTATQRATILAAAGQAGELARALAAARRPSEIARAVGRRPVEAVALAGADGDPAAQRSARDWLGSLRHVALEITGSDVVAAGIPAGPAVGAALARARAARLDGLALDRRAQLAAALGSQGAGG
jgi:tRNA nucleotidyltransferase (CCA-adding enzyme)